MARAPRLGEVSALKATRLAEDPEFTVMRCLTPIKAASLFSKSVLKRPEVSQPSSDASTMCLSSSASSNLPDGGTMVAPGRKGCGASAIAAYSSTRAAICARRALVLVFSIRFRGDVSGSSLSDCSRLVAVDLGKGEGAEIVAAHQAAGPVHGQAQGPFQVQFRAPVEAMRSLRNIELEQCRLMRMIAGIDAPRRAFTPEGGELVHDPFHWLGVVTAWPEVESFCENHTIAIKTFGERQVAAQRFQHMLPGADGARASDDHWFAQSESRENVGDQSVSRPVAAANHVPCTHGRQGHAILTIFIGFEKRVAIGRGHELSAALATAVGVVAAHRLVLTVGPDPFLVLVALVGGHIDHGAHGWALAYGLQKVDGAHDVGGVSLYRV